MNKFIGYLVLPLMLWGAVLPAVAAPNINQFTGEVARVGGYDTGDVTEYTLSASIGKVIKSVLALVGLIFLILTIYAGILWMTAGGNEEHITKAVNILKAATIGLIIVIAAYGITVFLLVAVGTMGGQPVKVGGGDASPEGFWNSFGKNLKENWWRFLF